MEQNLDSVCDVIRFASRTAWKTSFSPLGRTTDTTEDARWFETSPNWPHDIEKAIGVVRHVIHMKRQGYHVADSSAQLGVMVHYFHDPHALRISTQSHVAHERRLLCERR